MAPSMARRMARRLGLLLAVAALPLALWAALPLLSGAESPQSIQHKIDAKRAQIEQRRGRERVLTSDISAATERISSLQGEITQLQTKQVKLESDLAAKRAELARIQEELRRERLKLARLRDRLARARVLLAKRLVDSYKNDEPDIVTVVLSSHGFADLLERGEFMQRVSEQDQKIIEIVRSAKADATATAQRLNRLEHRQQHLTQIVQQRRDQIASTKMDLIGTKVGLASTRAGKAHALAGVRTERHQLEGNLSGLKQEQSKIQATLQQSQGNLPAGPIKHGNGSLIWPVNGPITSPFCERRAWEACHPGIDIGVPSGTPIRAAAAGRVALVQSAGASGGYGNFTCIQHTGALSTCYAHQSSIGVSVGQSVSQGQVIGLSGCTGLCFGPHLHFEVRINGAVTNPLNYL